MSKDKGKGIATPSKRKDTNPPKKGEIAKKLKRDKRRPSDLDIQIDNWKEKEELWGAISDKITRTRYQDDQAMLEMNIINDIRWMFNRVGITRFMELKRETYFHITAEVLYTMRVDLGDYYLPHELWMQIGGKLKLIYASEFNEMVGCLTDISEVENEGFNANEFWRSISGRQDDYNANTAKVAFIRNPVIAYMDRILSNTLFSQSEGSCIPRGELYVLWCMMNVVHFNVAAYFFLQLYKFSTHLFQKVNIGGLITPIAEHYNVDLTRYQPIRGDPDLILTSCA